MFFIAGGFLDTRLTTGHFEPGLKVLITLLAEQLEKLVPPKAKRNERRKQP